jgi:hypothetical protein
MLNNPTSTKKVILKAKFKGNFFATFSCFAARCLLVIAGQPWWTNQK